MAPSAGWLASYRRRIGPRSFIFQIWLLGWTALYVTWLVLMYADLSSRAAAAASVFSPHPQVQSVGNNSPLELIDSAAGATSAWFCFFMGWCVVGMPVGIAMVATLERS